MTIGKSFESILGLLALFLLAGAVLMILQPFATALLWAAILAYSTWPVFSRIDKAFGDRRGLAATAMTLLMILVLVLPFGIVAASLADDTARLIEIGRATMGHGLPALPSWVAGLPLVGGEIDGFWKHLASDPVFLQTKLRGLVEPGAEIALGAGKAVGKGLATLGLSIFIAWFLYRDGMPMVGRLRSALNKVTGRTEHLLHVAGSTVRGVVYGILGTALVQGILAGLGFWVAGVPGALFLGFVTFLVSPIPVGPPLVWGPAALWLFSQGHMGWAIFVAVWGFGIVSSVDNVLKPWLISRGSNLPLVLVLLGAFGGIVAFGFVGIFLGPTLLAVAFNLVSDWTTERAQERAETQPDAANAVGNMAAVAVTETKGA